MKTGFAKNFGFWALILLLISYIVGYTSSSADELAGGDFATGLLYLASLALAVYGLWRQPQQRVWSLATLGLAVAVWLVAYALG